MSGCLKVRTFCGPSPPDVFHVSTTFAILRHNRVSIGKFDYLLGEKLLTSSCSVTSASYGRCEEAPQAEQGDEADMAAAKRKIELISALINDIRDEDIQGEYMEALGRVRSAVVNLWPSTPPTALRKTEAYLLSTKA